MWNRDRPASRSGVRWGLAGWVGALVAVVVVAALVWSVVQIAAERADPGVARSPSVPTPDGVPLLAEVWSVTDAVWNGGSWFVLDRSAAQVHRIDPRGSRLYSFGREGLGPGEFRNPQALVVRGDSVIVAERSGLLHVYGLDGDHIADRPVDLRDCTGSGVEDLIATARALVVVAVCLKPDLALEARLLAESDGDWRVIGRSSPSHNGDRRVNPYWAPVLTSFGPALAFGLVAEDCLAILDFNGLGERRVCHDDLQRLPVSREDARSLRDLARQGQSTGFRVETPSALPPFDAVFDGGDGTLLYRAPSPAGNDAKQLVRLGNDGQEEVLDLPPAPYVFVSGRQALLAWDAAEGSHLQFQPLEAIQD